MAIYEPKSSFAVFAILMDLVINNIYTIITMAATRNPSSSPITAKIKSVVFGYK